MEYIKIIFKHHFGALWGVRHVHDPRATLWRPKGPQKSQKTLGFIDKTHMEKSNAQNLIKPMETNNSGPFFEK